MFDSISHAEILSKIKKLNQIGQDECDDIKLFFAATDVGSPQY